jgi:putative sugar O-methyltransferase
MERSAVGPAVRDLRPKVVKFVGWRTPLVAARVRLRGRSVASELGTAIEISDSWVIALGWRTWVERNVGDRSPRDTLGRAGCDVPEALYLDGCRLPSLDETWAEIEGRRVPASSRCLVAAPLVDSGPVPPEVQLPETEAEFRNFRRLDAMQFVWPLRGYEDPRGLRDYQLLRWTDPCFFRDKVQPFRESTVGWGDDEVVDTRPISNTYTALYWMSMLMRETGSTGGRDVVQIGGGFGNFARVAEFVAPDLFASHTILDLPKLVRLQHWFLEQEFPGEVAEPNRADRHRFRFVDDDHLEQGDWPHDVVVAGERLTELDPAQLNFYLDRVVLPARLVHLVIARKLLDSPITYDWVIQRMLDNGFAIRRVDAMGGRNFIALLLSRD